MKAGIVLNPGTPAYAAEPVLADVDYVLQMTVNPGYGGQSFIPGALANIKKLRAMIDERQLPVDIQVDGGINPTTAQQCVQAGATILVAGSAVFKEADLAKAIAQIRGQ